MEGYGEAREAADDNMAARCMHAHVSACAHTATQKYAKNTVFYGNNGFVSAFKCYVLRALRVLLRSAHRLFNVNVTDYFDVLTARVCYL